MTAPNREAARDPGASEELLARCKDHGFTPGARGVAGLLELWRAPERSTAQRKAIVAALCRGEGGVARKLAQGFDQAEGGERAMRLRVLARIARRLGPEVVALEGLLDAGLKDPEPRVVREAARAIGKLDASAAAAYEGALVSVARGAALPERRAAVEALGLTGGDLAGDALRELAGEGGLDEDLGRRLARARTLIERRTARGEARPLLLDSPVAAAVEVRMRCRGAADIVADELRARLPAAQVSGLAVCDSRTLTLRWAGPVAALDRLRTPLDWGLVFPLPPISAKAPAEELAARVVAGVCAPALAETLQALTDGPVRFRLSFAQGGSRRAVVWSIAQALDARQAALRNDSRAVSWTIEVDEARSQLVALPRRPDPRFDYRVAHLPASSHPTLAAIMARVAAPQPGERVWDPFCGCAAELIECSRLADALRLIGTDRDPQAIAAARANVEAAGLDPARVRIEEVDVYAGSPAKADVILTNPPMGRRTALAGGLHASLRRFVSHAARTLSPGGRLVWVTPAAQVTAAAGAAAGLRVRDHGSIDMSGMRVVLQEMRR